MTSSDDLTNATNSSTPAVKLDTKGGIAFITIDVPNTKVNSLGTKTMHELNALIDEVGTKKHIEGLVIRSGKPDGFIAGADVTEIRELQRQPQLEAYKASQLGKEVFTKIDRLHCTVVAAINGICLGGGTELTLACDYRIASTTARIGLPEVKLGFIPGWGGCVRLPRIVGVQKAIELISSGKVLDGRRAWKARLVDEVVEPDQLLARAEEIAAGARPARFTPTLKQNAMEVLLEQNPLGLSVLRTQAGKLIQRETKGKYPAPKEALNLIVKSIKMPAEKAFELESGVFSRLAVTDVSKNLVGIFFAQTESKKLPADLTAKPSIKTIGVLGAGVMGAGIAQACANVGYKVIVKDVETKFLDKGKATVAGLFDKLVERKKLTRDEADKKLSEMKFTLSYSDLADCDLIIEAVLEDLKVKQQALAECDRVAIKPYVFASNTSSLSIDQIAEGSKDPSKVVGLHFFNPVHKMPLVEVVRGAKTSSRALAGAMVVALKIDKTTVITKDSPGFVVNRILAPYLREAAIMAEEGVPIDDIDKAMKAFGMPMGPLVLLDEIGLDISAKVIHVMHDFLGERMAEPTLLKDIQRLKLLGKKGGKGIYLYDEKGKIKSIKEKKKSYNLVNPDVQDCIKAPPNKKTPGDIQDRLVLLMLNEAARCLEEGVITDPAQLDLAMIFGTGYPPFQGGILKYADATGIEIVYEKLDLLSRVVGPRYAPCRLLSEMAASRSTFYSNAPARIEAKETASAF